MFKYLVLVALSAATSANPLQPSSINGTIRGRTGGKLAPIESFPFQVSIHYNHYTACSGAIISEDWVLTAATCFINELSEEASIRAGSSVFSEGGRKHEVDDIIIHPRRDSKINLYRYDIALVHVKEPFQFDKTRQPISMFNADERAEPASTAFISGWGDSYPINPTALLHSEELRIAPRYLCDENYPDEVDRESTICVVYSVDDNGNPCTGDYGSPLTIKGRLAGIVGLRVMYCGTEDLYFPTFHTEVASYRSWIMNVTGI